MAGVKGRSGRRPMSISEKRLATIDKAWDVVGECLNNPAITLRDKLPYAIDIVKKNIPQAPLVDLSTHTHFQFEYKQVDENTVRASQSPNGSLEQQDKVEGFGSGQTVRKNDISGSRIDEEGFKPTKG